MIKIEHYAFKEGRAGYYNGCDLRQNPYRNDDGNVYAYRRKAFDNWKAGWSAANDAHAERGIAKRQARMGYEI